MGIEIVQLPTMCSRSPIAGRLAAAVLIVIPYATGLAEAPDPNDCGARECMSPVLDVGVVYPLPVGQYGITELMNAVEMGDLAMIESLLASGVDLDARNDSGATALLMASAAGRGKAVERLLVAGADPDIASNRGDTPLAMAIQYGNPNIAVLLLRHGADPDVDHNADNARLRKPVLVRAAVLGQSDVVQLLIERGVDLNKSGLEALNAALWRAHEQTARLLVDAGLDLNAPTYDAKKYSHMQNGERVLHTAVQQGLVSSVQLLLERGADVNGKSVHGQSALYFAVKENHPDVVAMLLEAGASVVAEDLAAALDAGHREFAKQLLGHVDLTTLGAGELDGLIARADAVNDQAILERLFAAREVVDAPVSVTQFLYAKADEHECRLVLWDLGHDSEQTVYASSGSCDQGYFFDRSAASLYVVDDHAIRRVSLDDPQNAADPIELPAEMIAANLSSLKQRIRTAYNVSNADGTTARIADAGTLASGDLAIVVHSWGPADETYGYLYALNNATWRLVEEKQCHRFDPCRFDQVAGHSISERPSNMTVWHPDLRRNPYFVDKTESRNVHYEDIGWNGIVTLEIDGQTSLLHYVKGESGHCLDDCVYTAGLSLELPGQGPVEIAAASANNSIVGRYALVWSGPWPQCELIDLGTGKSVFGNLQVASWIY